MRRLIRTFALAVAALGLAVGSAPDAARSQSYPVKPITLVVPFAAGGPTDVIARMIGAVMSQKLGQQVIIENVAGAGGTTAASRVARLEPDGYSLLIHHVALPLGASLYKNLPYDTATAFETLGLINYGPFVLTTRLGYPATTPAELFASFKKDAGKITFAHAGIGSGSHLCGLVLMQALGFKASFAAYRGTGPALNDIVAGQVDVLCDQTTNAIPQIEAKKVKAFGITSPQRSPQLPDIPTMAELGLTTVNVNVWHALYAPKGVPADRVKTIHAALQDALADKIVQERFQQLGTLLFPADQRSGEAHAKKLADELAALRALVQSAGVEAVAN